MPVILFWPLRAWARLSALLPMLEVWSCRCLTACSTAVLRVALPSAWVRLEASKLSCMALRSFPRGPAMFRKVSSAFFWRASSRCWRSFSVWADSWLFTSSSCWSKDSCCSWCSFFSFSRVALVAMSSFSRALQAFTCRVRMTSHVTTMATAMRIAAATMMMRFTVSISTKIR